MSALARARYALMPDPGLLSRAQEHLDPTRVVFAEDRNAHQPAECDRLQALIDAG